MPVWRAARRNAGFTMIELLVVLALIGVLLTLGIPALNNFIHRSKIEGIARQTAALMQLARFQAIKLNGTTRVAASYATDEVYAFFDADIADGPTFNAAVDRELGRYKLPNGVRFWAAKDSPEGKSALTLGDNDEDCDTCPTTSWEEFRPDGTAAKPGAMRFGDERENYLEVRVATAATGRVQVAKFDPARNNYFVQGDGGTWKFN
jgi:prepilin-type N-terminal cleavage/methylation domain-containing protein